MVTIDLDATDVEVYGRKINNDPGNQLSGTIRGFGSEVQVRSPCVVRTEMTARRLKSIMIVRYGSECAFDLIDCQAGPRNVLHRASLRESGGLVSSVLVIDAKPCEWRLER